jgi:hypothetical protein
MASVWMGMGENRFDCADIDFQLFAQFSRKRRPGLLPWLYLAARKFPLERERSAGAPLAREQAPALEYQSCDDVDDLGFHRNQTTILMGRVIAHIDMNEKLFSRTRRAADGAHPKLLTGNSCAGAVSPGLQIAAVIASAASAIVFKARAVAI